MQYHSETGYCLLSVSSK